MILSFVMGVTTLSSDLGAKRLQLPRDAFPRIGHVVVMFEPASTTTPSP